MKNGIIIFCLILIGLQVVGQDIRERFSLGLSINPQLSTGLPREETTKLSAKDWIVGGAIGFSLAIKLKENHYFETGLILSRKGYSYGGKLDLNDSLKQVMLDYSGFYLIKSNSYWYYHYIDIPFYYKGNIVRKEVYSMYIKGGFIVNFLHNLTLKSTDVLNTETLVITTGNLRAKNIWLDPNRINLSGSLAFGFSFPIKQKQNISIEPNINLMLFPVLKDGDTYFINTGINISLWFF